MNLIDERLKELDRKCPRLQGRYSDWYNVHENDLRAFIRESMELMAKSVIEDIPNLKLDDWYTGGDSEHHETILNNLKQQLRDKYLTKN